VLLLVLQELPPPAQPEVNVLLEGWHCRSACCGWLTAAQAASGNPRQACGLGHLRRNSSGKWEDKFIQGVLAASVAAVVCVSAYVACVLLPANTKLAASIFCICSWSLLKWKVPAHA
jgi:hypothetical protein